MIKNVGEISVNMKNKDNFFNEMHLENQVRGEYSNFMKWLKSQDLKALFNKEKELERIFRLSGITFNVYGQEEAEERLIPFDFVPRIISSNEWDKLSKGIEQRVRAINSFLFDIYHDQEIIKAGILPIEMISNNDAFLPLMMQVDPPGGVYTHISGIDIVRTSINQFYVLEDNARTPSGVSYMLENRETMIQMFPELFSTNQVKPINSYPEDLLESLIQSAPMDLDHPPTVAVLTPGAYNSAYYEHSFLADHMGVELVENTDLKVMNGHIAMRTINGYKNIDVLYRRIDDDYIDPLNFNKLSQLGVPGIFDIYRAGRITIANAPGTGVADDKAIYSYMPEIVEFYSGQKPILENVPTWRCSDSQSLLYVLDNIESLVIKEVHGSGGYGMLIGECATKKEIEDFKIKIKNKPSNYIAQPTLALSTVPIFTKSGLAPRHVDLRPFALMSPNRISITPGGLTRVALKDGSLVVNSSQGGGTKDTWVLEA